MRKSESIKKPLNFVGKKTQMVSIQEMEEENEFASNKSKKNIRSSVSIPHNFKSGGLAAGKGDKGRASIGNLDDKKYESKRGSVLLE